MGSNLSHELASGDLDFLGLSLEAQLEIHLRSNFYPPIPLSMVTPCVEAIQAYWEDDYQKMIELPSPVMWRGQDTAPASAIIDQHRLYDWTVSYDYDAEIEE